MAYPINRLCELVVDRFNETQLILHSLGSSVRIDPEGPCILTPSVRRAQR